LLEALFARIFFIFEISVKPIISVPLPLSLSLSLSLLLSLSLFSSFSLPAHHAGENVRASFEALLLQIEPLKKLSSSSDILQGALWSLSAGTKCQGVAQRQESTAAFYPAPLHPSQNILNDVNGGKGGDQNKAQGDDERCKQGGRVGAELAGVGGRGMVEGGGRGGIWVERGRRGGDASTAQSVAVLAAKAAGVWICIARAVIRVCLYSEHTRTGTRTHAHTHTHMNAFICTHTHTHTHAQAV